METALIIIVNIIGVLPLLYLISKKTQLEREVFYFVPLICLSFFSSVYELVFTFFLKFSNVYWFRIYLLLEFVALFYLFNRLFKSRSIITLLYIFFSLYLSFFIFLFLDWKIEDSLEINSYLSVFSTIFLYLFCILWFRQVFLHFEVDNLFSSPIFILLCGELLYFSSTLFLFLMSDYFLTEKKHDFLAFWQLNVVMCMVYRIFLSVALYKCVKR